MGDIPNFSEGQKKQEPWTPRGKKLIGSMFPEDLFDSSYWTVGQNFWNKQKGLAATMGVQMVMKGIKDPYTFSSIPSLGVGTAFFVSGDKAEEFFKQFQAGYTEFEIELKDYRNKNK